MKIYELFNDEERKLIKKLTEIEIVDKDYNYDEITNIIENYNNYRENEKTRTDTEIVIKFIKIKKQFEEYFSFEKWKYKGLIHVEDINKEFKKMNIVGKRLIDIKATGNETYLSKESMVNCYNNSEELMENDNWELMKKITIDYIPETIERGVVASFNTPLIFVLDNNSSFEFVVKNFCYLCISKNKLTNNFKYNIDPKVLFKDVIGKKILKIEVTKISNDCIDKEYIVGRYICEDNLEAIKILFEDNYEIRYVRGMFILLKNNQICVTTIKEWKKCVKHYDWLFSKEAEPRFKNKKNTNCPELTEVEKALVHVLKMKKIPKGTILGMMSLIHALKIEEDMLEYFCDYYYKGNIESITKDDIFKKIMELSIDNND